MTDPHAHTRSLADDATRRDGTRSATRLGMRVTYPFSAALVGMIALAGLAACTHGVIGGPAEERRWTGQVPYSESSLGGFEDGGLGTSAAKGGAFDCPPTVPGEAPQRLVCTGLYADASLVTVAADVRAYEPARALFSDGAIKSRWVHLPAGQRIDTTNMDEWTFPLGTKFWKQFVVDGKKIETRFLNKVGPDKWVMATYRWNDAETDAVRLDTGELVTIGTDHVGDARYEIPTVKKCETCHAGRIDRVLGFEAVNLGLAGASGVTLAMLASEGVLTNPPASTTFTIPDDGTGLASQALGWLHVNCGITCHNTSPGAACGFRGMNLRLGAAELQPPGGAPASVQSLAAMQTTLNVASQLPAGGTYLRIAPGNPDLSAIPTLAGRRDASNPTAQMPPGISHVVDAAGVAALRAWIQQMQ